MIGCFRVLPAEFGQRESRFSLEAAAEAGQGMPASSVRDGLVLDIALPEEYLDVLNLFADDF